MGLGKATGTELGRPTQRTQREPSVPPGLGERVWEMLPSTEHLTPAHRVVHALPALSWGKSRG